jgi:putative (di)nucleoside polyphosphate hydrolase
MSLVTKPYRYGVVGVFTNTAGEILVCERSNTPGAWQFPQGGIDEGETPDETIVREVREELGTDKFDIVFRAVELTVYDFPNDVGFKLAQHYIGQKHHWYHLRFKEGVGPDLSQSDGEFKNFKWVPIARALDAAIEWKKTAYEDGLRLLGIGDF